MWISTFHTVKVLINLMYYITGYYRVNYDKTNWHRIVIFLKYYNHTCIPVQNRAQLIDDAYYFAMTGKINVYIFQMLIKYLKLETYYVPWYPMFNILTDMSAFLEFRESTMIKVSGNELFIA